MAILKDSVVQNGINGTVSGGFWVTKGIYISPDYSHSRATMELFESEAAYLLGDPALYQEDFLLSGYQNQVDLTKMANMIVEPGLVNLVPLFTGGSIVSGV